MANELSEAYTTHVFQSLDPLNTNQSELIQHLVSYEDRKQFINRTEIKE